MLRSGELGEVLDQHDIDKADLLIAGEGPVPWRRPLVLTAMRTPAMAGATLPAETREVPRA